MDALNIRFTLHEDTPIDEYLQDGIIDASFPQNDGTHQVIIKDADEALIESLHTDELAEFFGIDSEFVIACEVLEFA